LHLYRNGVEVASGPCRGVYASPAGKYLTIGCGNQAPQGVHPICFWEGRLDEMAIFHRALSRDEIEMLFHGPAGQPDKDKKGGDEPHR
jgi:hypothetical protein